jgi:hypothetical protein
MQTDSNHTYTVHEVYALIRPLSIGNMQKLNILYVFLGFKPAEVLYIYRWNDKPEVVTAILDKVGLHYKLLTVPKIPKWKSLIKRNPPLVAKIAITASSKLVEQLGVLHNTMSPESMLLRGFSRAAVADWEQKQAITLDFKQYPELIGDQWIANRNNPETDIEEYHKRSMAIAELAPELYAELKLQPDTETEK